MENKLNSHEWLKLNPDIVILDSDGWNRLDYDNSMNELITLKEFFERVAESTIYLRKINNPDMINFDMKIKVYKISAFGSNFYAHDIVEASQELTSFDVGDTITITIEEMSRDTYESLREFEGF